MTPLSPVVTVEQDAADGLLQGHAVAPCPFCGNARVFAGVLNVVVTEQGDEGFVTCGGCGACGPHTGGGVAEVVAIWNARGRQ